MRKSALENGRKEKLVSEKNARRKQTNLGNKNKQINEYKPNIENY